MSSPHSPSALIVWQPESPFFSALSVAASRSTSRSSSRSSSLRSVSPWFAAIANCNSPPSLDLASDESPDAFSAIFGDPPAFRINTVYLNLITSLRLSSPLQIPQGATIEEIPDTQLDDDGGQASGLGDSDFNCEDVGMDDSSSLVSSLPELNDIPVSKETCPPEQLREPTPAPTLARHPALATGLAEFPAPAEQAHEPVAPALSTPTSAPRCLPRPLIPKMNTGYDDYVYDSDGEWPVRQAMGRFVMPDAMEIDSDAPELSERAGRGEPATPATPTPKATSKVAPTPAPRPAERIEPATPMTPTSIATKCAPRREVPKPAVLPSPPPSSPPSLRASLPSSPLSPAQTRTRNTIPKRQITLARRTPTEPKVDSGEEDENDCKAVDEQWRVGKTPGHQGSHKRRAYGEKYDSSRVLKRPFRPPTRITPVASKKVQHVAASSSPPSESTDIPSSPSTSSSKFYPVTAAEIFPRPRPKFKPLARRAPSGKLKLSDIDGDAELIRALQASIRTHKQAVKYASTGEDEHTTQLISTWVETGREVADRLFSLLPKPEEEVKSTWSWWEEPAPEPMSREQVACIVRAGVNSKGDLVDDEGVPLFEEEEDLMAWIEKSCGASATGAIGSGSAMDVDDVDVDNIHVGHKPKEERWDRGAMLLRLGVDPALLRFDAENDDWEEMDE